MRYEAQAKEGKTIVKLNCIIRVGFLFVCLLRFVLAYLQQPFSYLYLDEHDMSNEKFHSISLDKNEMFCHSGMMRKKVRRRREK